MITTTTQGVPSIKSFILVFAVSILVFSNTFQAEFVYDDSQAVVSNPDVISPSSALSLLSHDFWGNSMSHRGSHKSWRPLTTLTFRWNYIMGGLDAKWFHVTNVFLHGVCSCLFHLFISHFIKEKWVRLLSSLFFSLHPIHCEAVASVVGRADVLMTITVLSGLIIDRYYKDTKLLVLLAVIATAFKETGVILLVLLMAMEFVERKGKPSLRSLHLLCSLVVLCCLRHSLNSFHSPTFSASDNPASHSESFTTRTFTFLYLPIFHLQLMVWPETLCFDWSMDSIPLVTSPLDYRLIISICVYIGLGSTIWSLAKEYIGNFVTHILHLIKSERSEKRCCSPPKWDINGNVVKKRKNRSMEREITEEIFPFSPRDSLLCALSILSLPHLLASNLFTYVGFVAAERILYLPSVGYCILCGILVEEVNKRLSDSKKVFLKAFCVAVLMMSASRTYSRNEEWKTEEILYRSAIDINPAKAYANLGHVLARTGRLNEAEEAYLNALQHRPNMADTQYNLGILYKESGRRLEALEAYEGAIRIRPGFANAWLNLGLVQWELERDPLSSFLKCTRLDSTHLKMPRHHQTAVTSCAYNAGRYLAAKEKHFEAVEIFRMGLELAPPTYTSRVSILNMLGESLSTLGDTVSAEKVFKLALDEAPNHVPAHLTMGHLRAKQNRTTEASHWFSRAINIDPNSVLAHLHHGIFKGNTGDLHSARKSYEKVLELDPINTDALSAIATVSRELGMNEEAERYLRRLCSLHPSSTNLSNMGAILHLNAKYSEAREYYRTSLQQNPNDTVTNDNLRKLERIMRKQGLN